MLIDRYGRTINYLRISVTNQCNLHCLYCRPRGRAYALPTGDELTFEEIGTVARAAASLGVEHIRLTGGEPLLREDLPELVRKLADIPEITDLALTTNGQLLAEQAPDLAAAGLHRVNISMDSLDAERYHVMTGGGSLERVWAGIEASRHVGLEPIKLNVVMVRGYNHDELPGFVRIARDQALHVRFIELMPVGPAAAQAKALFYPAAEALRQIEDLHPAHEGRPGPGPAQVYRVGRGTIGFIASVTNPPCPACNRLRITSQGKLRPCLTTDLEIDLKPALAGPEPEAAVGEALRAAVAVKPEQGLHLTQASQAFTEMCQVGG